MTAVPRIDSVDVRVYAEVQLFYARQMRLLDDVEAEAFAATFAVDGVFDHSPGSPPARGRSGIADEVRSFNERRFAADPVQRRHWFGMLDVCVRNDASIGTRFYALVVTTRPGQPQPVIAPSCTVDDVLVREDGELRTLSRSVSQDHLLPFAQPSTVPR